MISLSRWRENPLKFFPSPAGGRGQGEGMFSTENRPLSTVSHHHLQRRGTGIPLLFHQKLQQTKVSDKNTTRPLLLQPHFFAVPSPPVGFGRVGEGAP
jgi:hypothetical protein